VANAASRGWEGGRRWYKLGGHHTMACGTQKHTPHDHITPPPSSSFPPLPRKARSDQITHPNLHSKSPPWFLLYLVVSAPSTSLSCGGFDESSWVWTAGRTRASCLLSCWHIWVAWRAAWRSAALLRPERLWDSCFLPARVFVLRCVT
jgi:hypothetical protein